MTERSTKPKRGVTKAEIVDAIAAETGLTKVAVQKTINGLVDIVVDTVAKGDSAAIQGLATFSPGERKAREGWVNPKTKKVSKVRKRRLVKTSIHKRFEDALNSED